MLHPYKKEKIEAKGSNNFSTFKVVMKIKAHISNCRILLFTKCCTLCMGGGREFTAILGRLRMLENTA